MNTVERISGALHHLLEAGVVVAVRLGQDDNVLDVCHSLVKGGLSVIEVTLTTPGALEAIAELAPLEGILVGAGTVLSRDDAEQVAAAGGRFAFSPVLDPAVIDFAHELGLLAVPGTATPSEILAAHHAGADLVKVFPAGPLGGPDFLRKVRGPLPQVPLLPTSGPTADTIDSYFAAGAVAVGVGGDELFPPGFTTAHVEKAAGRIVDAVRAARG